MFDKSSTWKRYSNPKPKVVRVHLGHVPELDTDDRVEKTVFRIAILIAVVLHIGFFLVQMPELISSPDWVSSKQKVYVVQQVQFKPPATAVEQLKPKPQEKRRLVPVPDPTPDEPEPIPIEEIEFVEPDFDLAEMAIGLGIPDAPAGDRLAASGPDALPVGGDVLPPVKVYAPSPPYTEDARKGRVQGIVILEAIIDVMGRVDRVEVLKGLPFGLTESAVEAAAAWTFEPATRNGVPVPVFFNLTIRFSLQ
jgi:TonB family protein